MQKLVHKPVLNELLVDENETTELYSGYNYTNAFNKKVPKYNIYCFSFKNNCLGKRNFRKRSSPKFTIKDTPMQI